MEYTIKTCASSANLIINGKKSEATTSILLGKQQKVDQSKYTMGLTSFGERSSAVLRNEIKGLT